MAEQKVKLTELPTATDTLDTAQLLVNQNSTDQKLAITHLLRAKNNLSELEDFAQARANLDVPSVEEVNNKLSGFIDGSYTFIAGGSLASRSDFIWDEDTKSWYYWSGVLPKEVPAASNPDSTGGTGVGAWIPVGESVLRGDLANPTGSSLIGYQYSADGSVSRTVQDKLSDFVALEDFGGKDDGGVTDNSLAFQKAFAAGHRRIYLKGSGVYAMKTRDIELPDMYYIASATQKAEIKYLGSDTTFSMFTLTGSGPASNQLKNGGMFENVVISSDFLINWIVGRHVQNLDFHKVFFYNAATLMNDYHYVYFTRCERWGSPFTGRSDLNTISYISESPKFNLCFSSNSPIDAWDTADVTVTSCTMFAGDYAIRTRNTLVTPTAPDLFAGYPVLITGNVFDAIKGPSLDLQNIAYSTIAGNLISAGRDTNSHGAYIKGGRSNTITGNTFTYCGNYGLFLENVKQTAITSNQFNGNKNGGLGLNGCDVLTITGGSAGTSYVRGGYYVQPIGVSDAASNSTNILIVGMAFDTAMTNKYYLDTSIGTGNRVIACTGVPDSVYGGGTSSRPTTHGYGLPYYDTTLGKPIWWNATTGTWQDAMGNNV
ncbi:right-handed parallel beta-helix repeat-containing protein [Enterobacter hormaechei]